MAQRILIVDDEPNIAASLEFLLRRGGYEVRVAHDGEEALAQAESFGPQLVLLDVMMPKLKLTLRGSAGVRLPEEPPDARAPRLHARG